MIHIYEDSLDSSLSKLFLSAYTEEAANRIFYSDGATNLVKRAQEVRGNGSERVALYVDISPDNLTKVVDLIECGYNARDAIICNIRTGKVLFVYNDISIDYPGFEDFKIDVLTGKDLLP